MTQSDTFRRGGMSSNPFGGESRIDRINLLDFLEPNSSAEKVLYSCVIQDASSNYLYAFLGRNGTSAEEFFSSWQYFFKITSTDKASWDHHRTIKISYTKKGQKIVDNHYLTDNELQLMCFDKHYELSGLSKYMHIDRFRSELRNKREKILINNINQVQEYINSIYNKELGQIANGQQVPLRIWGENLIQILVDPPSPVHLASILYVSSKIKRLRRVGNKKPTQSKYAILANEISKQTTEPIGDWGPLSQINKVTT